MNIIDLTEPADDPKVVLEAAISENLRDVVVVGHGPEGLYIASSSRPMSSTIYALSKAIHHLHELELALDEDDE